MSVYFLSWLFYSALGMLFGLFPGYILFSGTVSLAVMAYNKNVPRWMIRFSNGNPRTRKWDITPFKNVHSQHRAEFIGAAIWFILAFAAGEYIIISSFLSHHITAGIISEELGFPVFLILITFIPYLLTKRYVYSLGEFSGKKERHKSNKTYQ